MRRNFTIFFLTAAVFLFCGLPVLCGTTVGSTVVFPFRVDSSGKSHQWLGRAISLHMAAGLTANSIAVLPDDEVRELLNDNLVSFPYSMTKATVMKLAMDSGAHFLIWGEIMADKDDDSLLKVRAFVMNLKDIKQKHLPLLNADIDLAVVGEWQVSLLENYLE